MNNNKHYETDANGFFSDDNKLYINLNVSKSSPNRKGNVIGTFTAKSEGKDYLVANIQFRDTAEAIVIKQ